MADYGDGCGGEGLLPTTICGFSWRRCIHVIDAFLLLIVHVVQGSILNYYIISYYSDSTLPYFWFVGDFLCLFVFAGTLTLAYKYFNRIISADSVGDGSSFKLSPARFINGYSATRFGVLPLSYVSWLFYSFILIGKIAIIFKTLASTLDPNALFGPQLLQVTIASSAVIFLLLAESHNWAKHRSARYHFVTSTCSHSGLAVLDTVSLLSVLLPKAASLIACNTPDPTATPAPDPEHIGPPAYLLDIVLFLGLINLTLPALALYRLGLSEPNAEKVQATLILPFNVIHDIAHLLFVDIPFLIVRAYLWLGHGQHTSLFMMKNVLGILATCRSLHPDISALVARRRRKREEGEGENNPQCGGLLEMKDQDEKAEKKDTNGKESDLEAQARDKKE